MSDYGGQPGPYGAPGYVGPTGPRSGTATTSLVLGLVVTVLIVSVGSTVETIGNC